MSSTILPLSDKAFAPAPGRWPVTAVGLVLLADAVLLRLILRADEAQVWFLGHPLPWVCGVRRSFGVPCPTCGLTRSVVLSLHGDFARAWLLAPAGPLIALGLVAFGAALVATGSTPLWLRRAAWIYAFLLLVVWISGWAVSFSAALGSR